MKPITILEIIFFITSSLHAGNFQFKKVDNLVIEPYKKTSHEQGTKKILQQNVSIGSSLYQKRLKMIEHFNSATLPAWVGYIPENKEIIACLWHSSSPEQRYIQIHSTYDKETVIKIFLTQIYELQVHLPEKALHTTSQKTLPFTFKPTFLQYALPCVATLALIYSLYRYKKLMNS